MRDVAGCRVTSLTAIGRARDMDDAVLLWRAAAIVRSAVIVVGPIVAAALSAASVIWRTVAIVPIATAIAIPVALIAMVAVPVRRRATRAARRRTAAPIRRRRRATRSTRRRTAMPVAAMVPIAFVVMHPAPALAA